MDAYLKKIQNILQKLLEKYDVLFVPLYVLTSLLVCCCLVFGICQVIRTKHEEEPQAVDINVVKESEESSLVEESIYIDISGGVVKPGVIEVKNNSRVSDVVNLSGGFSELADLSKVSKSINLAKKVTDGEKIVIPIVGQENGKSEDYISINDATMSELQTLKGVGEVRAESIISNRPYFSIDDLITKNVLPLTVFEGIKTQLEL